MGEVYQATDTRLDRTVAIKVLPEHVAADPDLKQRFEREARTVAALNHPHICTLYDIGNQDGIDFLVMEYLEGETLAQRLEKGALPLDQALTIAIEIADALDKAHRQGIVHRDIKPSNVMLAESGAQLLDFGIAVRFSGAELETVTRSTVVVAEIGGVAGTLPYMAPEVLRGEPVDERSDIWSLGVLLYETVTGVRPFGGKSGVDVTSAILRDQPKTFSHAVPGPLQGIVRRCLAKEPDRRYQRAGELRAALEPVEATASDRVTTVPGTGAGQPTSPEAITGSGGRPARSLRGTAALVGGGMAVVLAGLYVAGGLPSRSPDSPGSTALQPISSVAVLPFENISGDSDQEYFAVGMTDLLTTNLGSISSLRVVSRQSVMRFTRSTETPAQIAAQLEVDALIMGSVFRATDDVRITAQLVDARTNEQVWGESYVGRAGAIFALQSETAQAVVAQIGVTVTGEEERRLASVQPIDPEAWDAYFRGRHQLEESTEDGVSVAVEAFTRVLEREPGFALAHADLARAYLSMIQQGMVSSQEYMPKARAAAEEALRIDPTLADAHVSLALVDYRSSRDWDGLDRRFERAIELNPSSANAWHHYSHYLMSTLQVDAAVDAAVRGLEVDPLSRNNRLHVAVTYMHARRWDEVIETALETLERYPDYSRVRLPLGTGYNGRGEFDEAIRQAETLVEGSREAFNVMALAVFHANAGHEAEARALLDELLAREAPAHEIALVQSGLGEVDLAFSWLERAIDANQGALADLLVTPGFDALRSDARWPVLLRRAGFSEELVSMASSRS